MTSQPFSPARIVLFTADACLTADLATDGERVKEVLNHPQKLLELQRLTYSNPDRPGIPLVDYPAGSLRKSDVGCVIVLSEPAQATMRKFGVYVQKRPLRVSIMIPGMVVVGTLHIQGRYDPTLLMSDSSEAFIPLTEAGVVRARTTTPTSVPPERLTMFVNRAHIAGVLLANPVDHPVSFDEAAAAPPTRQPQPISFSDRMPVGSQSHSHTGRLRRLTNPDTT